MKVKVQLSHEPEMKVKLHRLYIICGGKRWNAKKCHRNATSYRLVPKKCWPEHAAGKKRGKKGTNKAGWRPSAPESSTTKPPGCVRQCQAGCRGDTFTKTCLATARQGRLLFRSACSGCRGGIMQWELGGKNRPWVFKRQ